MSHLDSAMALLRAGLCVLPARLDPKMPALARWKDYQRRLPTEPELRRWFTTDRPMCIVTGAVSGNLEMIDFDAGGERFEAWQEVVACDAPDLITKLVIERSPSGGRHVVYRCQEAISPNLKLAQRRIVAPTSEPVTLFGKQHVPRRADAEWEVVLTLIETRGEGGLYLCHPSPGYDLLQGSFEQVPIVAAADREALLRAAWSLNELPASVEPDRIVGGPAGRPGDEFNERGNVRAVLERHGWQCVRRGENEYWRRPGKDIGWSATLKNCVFYVFSSNAAPFDPNKAYSPFGVYARLEHGGDFSAAAAGLRASGFGQAVANGDESISAITNRHVAPAHPTSSAMLIEQPVCDVSRETVAWLWPGRIPLGKLTLLAGDPGLGKSLVTLDMAARVSRGMPWPDNHLLAQPIGVVILFNAEDDLADTIAPRLDKAGADDTKIIAIEGVQRHDPKDNTVIRWSFSLENDLPLLEKSVAKYADARLIVIDPISAYCGKIDSHKNAEVRSMLAPLAEFAGRYRVAVVAVTHLSKSVVGKAIYRAMGSLAFTAAARAVWSVVKDSNDGQRRLFLPAKLNLAGDPDGLAYRIVEGRVVWESEPVKMHADEAFAAEVAAVQTRGKGQARQEAMLWLQSRLARGPIPSAELLEEAKELGITEITLRRAFKAIGGKATKAGFGANWVWALGEGAQDDQHAPDLFK